MQINLNPTSERGASRDAVNRPRETLGDSHLISSDPRSRFGLVCDLLCCRGNMAVVRDADSPIGVAATPGGAISEADKAFRSACGSLRHVGLSCPPAHGQFSDGSPRVGVFIVPNGTDDGMLETLCLHSVSTLPEFPCVDAYFQCLQAHQIAPKSLHKARAHAWLASRPEPDRRVGEAAQAGYWPWNSQAFDNLWAFLRSM